MSNSEHKKEFSDEERKRMREVCEELTRLSEEMGLYEHHQERSGSV